MGTNKPARVVVQYHGNVQGVGFRMTAVQLVRGANISGWVRNEPDGSVLLDAEGSRTELEAFLTRIADTLAPRIDDVREDWREPQGRTGAFTIKY